MKSKTLMGAALAALLSLPLLTAAQSPVTPLAGGGPGLVMSASGSVSDLPQTALKFIHKHYPDVNVSKVEKEFSPQGYDVKLANGVEIDFDTQGSVREIDAAEGSTLAPQVLRALMNRKAYNSLARKGKLHSVESIDFTYNNNRLIKVETAPVSGVDLVFDTNGNIVLMEVDD